MMATFGIALVILTAVAGSTLVFKLRRIREEQGHEAEEMYEKALAQKQWLLGGRASSAIKQAARNNATAHLRTDGTEGDAGPLMVRTITNNGGNYTVLVAMSGTNQWYGGREWNLFFVLQFNIDVRANKLCALFGSHGPSACDSIENFDSFLQRACDHVEKKRLYQAA